MRSLKSLFFVLALTLAFPAPGARANGSEGVEPVPAPQKYLRGWKSQFLTAAVLGGLGYYWWNKDNRPLVLLQEVSLENEEKYYYSLCVPTLDQKDWLCRQSFSFPDENMSYRPDQQNLAVIASSISMKCEGNAKDKVCSGAVPSNVDIGMREYIGGKPADDTGYLKRVSYKETVNYLRERQN